MSSGRISQNVGSPLDSAVVTVDNSKTWSFTLTRGYKTLELFNNDQVNNVYYGGPSVTPSTGIPIFPQTSRVWNDVQPGFTVYLIADSGKTAAIRQVQYLGYGL